jgi:hypothetical protein
MTGVRRAAGIVVASGLAAAGIAAAGYLGLVTGAVPVDLGVGRRVRPLGPRVLTVDAPREVVFDVIAQPYLGRVTRAMRGKIQVLAAGSDMVLAAHRTPVGGGLVATTVETVRFVRPQRVEFRLVRGPVPHVVEEFVLREHGSATELTYRGELGTDLGPIGQRWGDGVAARWEQAVAETLQAVIAEAERRARQAPRA